MWKPRKKLWHKSGRLENRSRPSKLAALRSGPQGVRLFLALLQDVSGNLFQRSADFEAGRFRATPPTIHLPMRSNELDVRLRREVEQHRSLADIELLREGEQGLC